MNRPIKLIEESKEVGGAAVNSGINIKSAEDDTNLYRCMTDNEGNIICECEGLIINLRQCLANLESFGVNKADSCNLIFDDRLRAGIFKSGINLSLICSLECVEKGFKKLLNRTLDPDKNDGKEEEEDN